MEERTPDASEASTPAEKPAAWWQHPFWAFLAIISSITTLAGFVLSIYFYTADKEYPELRFALNPTRRVVVDRTDSPKLVASYGGTDLANNLSRAQLAVWNSGKR